MALEKTFDAKSAEKRIYENWEKEKKKIKNKGKDQNACKLEE